MNGTLRVLTTIFLLSSLAVAQQYVISTYAGVAAAPPPSADGSIGAPMGVATDPDGNVYFVSASLNSVFKLTPNGILTRIAGTSRRGYSGDGGPATSAQLQLSVLIALARPASLGVDSAGNVFVADTGNHRIRRVSSSGIITTVAGNGIEGFSGDGGPATSARLNYPTGVAVDPSGNLFIVDLSLRVRKVSPGGIITTVAGNGTCCLSGDGGPAIMAQVAGVSIAVDRVGNLFIADTMRIRMVSPNGIITTVPGSEALPANGPRGGAGAVAVDGAGNVLVASLSSINRISPSGTVTTVAGSATAGGFSGDGGPATGARLSGAFGVAADSAGNLFIADSSNGRIRRVSTSGIISTVAGNGIDVLGNASFSGDGGPATNAQFSFPWSVAVDGDGNLFIADLFNNRIRKVTPGGIVTTVAGTGTRGFSGDGGPATNAQLSGPIGLAVDRAGNVFFVEADNGRVRKISRDGIISTVAGNGSYGFSGDGGPATGATLRFSSACNTYCGGLALDDRGNLFIADPGNSRIRKVDSAGIITTVAGNGTFGYSGDGGPATSAALLHPAGVAVDRDGNLFIAEAGRVRKVSTTAIITTVAGGGLMAGSGADGGPAINARLSSPTAIAVDGAGNLYIADPGANFFTGDAGDDPADHRIRKVSVNGIITTIAGTGTAGSSGEGVPAATAALNGPTSVAVDAAGIVYVADLYNNLVRVLRPTNYSLLIGAVVDAASQHPDPVAPGKIVVIYGAGLGPSQLIQNKPANGRVGTELGGTTVAFNGIAAPILYTSATQVAAIVPYSISGTETQVTVSYQGQASNAFPVRFSDAAAMDKLSVAVSAPSLFTLNQAGWGQAAAVNAVDGTVNTAANPVKVGAYISLYATGEGQTLPAGLDGQVSGPTAPRPRLPVSATAGGIPATIQYAGGAPGLVAGLLQVNVQIPSGVQPGGYVPVVLQVGDQASSAEVWIAVTN